MPFSSFIQKVLDSRKQMDMSGITRSPQIHNKVFNSLLEKYTNRSINGSSSLQALIKAIDDEKEISNEDVDKINQIIPFIVTQANYENATFLIRRKLKEKHFPYQYIIFPRALKKSKMQDNEEKLKDTLLAKKIIKMSQIGELIDYYRIKNQTKYDLIMLQLTSGIRFNEIWTSTFDKINDDLIIQSNISKDKWGHTREIKILYFDADEWLSLLEKIRNEHPNEGKGTVTNIYSRPVNYILKKTFQDATASSHILRKIYAALIYDSLPSSEKKKKNKIAFISNLLTHSNMGSSMHYDIEIDYEN